MRCQSSPARRKTGAGSVSSWSRARLARFLALVRHDLERRAAVAPRRYREALGLEPLEGRLLMAVFPAQPPDDLAPVYTVSASEQPDGPAALAETILGFDADTAAFVSSGGGALGDATPTGTSYLVYENWGGTWWDAEKTLSNTEDDMMCWAAAASNILAWTGWGLVGGMTTTDQIFGYFQSHWTDDGGMMEFGWDWWFDGTNNSQGWSGWSQVDVAGGGFYPSQAFSTYYHRTADDSQAMAAIDNYLRSGYGVTLGIYGPGGHAITCWGFDYNPSNPSQYYGVWVTDSDDDKNSDSPPDRLRYYQVAYSGGKWYLQNYYGSNSWYIGEVQALARNTQAPPPDPAPENEIRGSVFNDANGDGARQGGEAGSAGQRVYIDANHNGRWDSGVVSSGWNFGNQAITDYGTTSSTITISNAAGRITDVDVTIWISHTWNADLTVWLTSPDGTQVELIRNVGGSSDNFHATVLDDQAATAISSGSAPYSGRFRPSQSLSVLNGLGANGVWTLSVRDDYGGDTGMLHGWTIQVASAEQSTLTDANGDFALTEVSDGNHTLRVATTAGSFCTTPSGGAYQVSVSGGQTISGRVFGIATPTISAWGAATYARAEGLQTTGIGQWYSFQTSYLGILTLQGLARDAGAVQLTLYDSAFNPLLTSASSSTARLDAWMAAGQTYYVRLTGTSSNADLLLANGVQYSSGTVIVQGTAGDDAFSFAAGTNLEVGINGTTYSFLRSSVHTVVFQGGAGNDSATLTGSSGNDTLWAQSGNSGLVGSGYSVWMTGTENVAAQGGGGADTAWLVDSAGDDVLVSTPTTVELTGPSGTLHVESFATVGVYAVSGGNDTAELSDSVGNDNVTIQAQGALMSGPGYCRGLVGFDAITIRATAGGNDTAWMFGSAGNDALVATPSAVQLSGSGYVNRVEGFDVVGVYGQGGNDTAELSDSAGNDTLSISPRAAMLSGSDFLYGLSGFAQVTIRATAGGTDTAWMFGSAGNDALVATPSAVQLSGSGYVNRVEGFDVVGVYGQGGNDTAELSDSAGDDVLTAQPRAATLIGPGYYYGMADFAQVTVRSTAGGADRAELFGSTGNDTLRADLSEATMSGSNYANRAVGFREVIARGGGGSDRAELDDSAGDDHLGAAAVWAELASGDARVRVEDFSWVRARSSRGGADTKHVDAVDYVLVTEGAWSSV